MNTIMQHRQRFIDFHAKVRLSPAGSFNTPVRHSRWGCIGRAGGNGAAQRCGARAAGASAAGGVQAQERGGGRTRAHAGAWLGVCNSGERGASCDAIAGCDGMGHRR
jgi:hypothetical protein